MAWEQHICLDNCIELSEWEEGGREYVRKLCMDCGNYWVAVRARYDAEGKQIFDREG
jgi:hypothetical protein